MNFCLPLEVILLNFATKVKSFYFIIKMSYLVIALDKHRVHVKIPYIWPLDIFTYLFCMILKGYIFACLFS